MKRAIIWTIAVVALVGMGATFSRVLPALWESNVLDCITVAAGMSHLMLAILDKAIKGEWL